MNNNSNPLGKMGELMPLNNTAPEPGKSDRVFEMIKPVYIRKLVEHLQNAEKVGKLIGMGGNNINSILRDNETRIVNELAARYVWENNYAPKPSNDPIQYVLIGANASKLKMLEGFLDPSVYRVTPLELK